MIQRGEYFRFALKARESVVIGRHCRRQDLDRDLALQLRVGRPVDLSHAAFANLRGDFVDAETRAGDESQRCREYRGERACGRDYSLSDAVVQTDSTSTSCAATECCAARGSLD